MRNIGDKNQFIHFSRGVEITTGTMDDGQMQNHTDFVTKPFI